MTPVGFSSILKTLRGVSPEVCAYAAGPGRESGKCCPPAQETGWIARKKDRLPAEFESLEAKKGRPRNPHPNRFVPGSPTPDLRRRGALRVGGIRARESIARCKSRAVRGFFGSQALRVFGFSRVARFFEVLTLHVFEVEIVGSVAAIAAQVERVEECRPLFPAARILTASGT